MIAVRLSRGANARFGQSSDGDKDQAPFPSLGFTVLEGDVRKLEWLKRDHDPCVWTTDKARTAMTRVGRVTGRRHRDWQAGTASM